MPPVDRRERQLNDDFVAADLEQMRLAVNYNRWLFSFVRPHLGRRIFEVGAGIGNMTLQFLDVADFVFAIEPNPACLRVILDTIGGRANFDCRPWRLEDCDWAEVRRYRLDTAVCINVLEHLADDAAAVQAMAGGIEAQGRIVLLVPAVPLAYGSIDRAVGHFRRYSKAALRRILQAADLQVEKLAYMNFVGLLGWMYNAHVSGKVQQSNQQIQLFDRLVPWLARAEAILPPPVGMSLLAVARKGVSP